jgi:hypothetical protein
MNDPNFLGEYRGGWNCRSFVEEYTKQAQATIELLIHFKMIFMTVSVHGGAMTTKHLFYIGKN